jgi:integrase
MGDRNVHEVQAHELEDYMETVHGMKKPKTFNNHLGIIKAMWALALKKKVIIEDVSLTMEPLELDDLAVSILKVNEVRDLLSLAQKDDAELLISFALQCFAGLRHSEMFSMIWGDIREEYVVVNASNAKTSTRRVVPILPPLKALLDGFKGMHPEVKVFKGSLTNFKDRWVALARKSGLVWKHNCLRHSFVSYRLAAVQDDNRVALEAGHTVTMLHQHYKAVVDESEARLYWALFADQGKVKCMARTLVRADL